MYKMPELIVMLTHHDKTVENAYEIFEQCKHSKAKIWGFKEKYLPLEEMKRLYAYMRKCGKITALEVVAYTEDECMKGAQMAVECGCDFLMGTLYFDSVNAICKEHNIKYMPFVGKVSQRPSILEGTVEEIIEDANSNIKKGVYGVDLLGYRYTGDASSLNKEVATHVHGPVCIAGSINSFQRLQEVIEAGADMFTIGSAFFEHCFGEDFCQQIDFVYDYIEKWKNKKC